MPHRLSLQSCRLSAALVAAGSRLRVPMVELDDRSGRCLLIEPARGRPLASFAARDEGLLAALERLGAGLAELHSLPPAVVDVRPLRGRPRSGAEGLDAQVRALMRPHPRDLGAAVHPATATRIDRLLSSMADLATRQPGTRAPLHRDLHPRQVFVTTDHVDVIDWDLAGPGDPALDLANLMAHVGKRWPAVANAALSALHAGYGAGPVGRLAARLPLHLCFHHLRRTCKALRLGAADRVVQTRLAAAERALHTDPFTASLEPT